MKCRDLISGLQEFNQDADVTLTTSEDITLSYICEDPNTKEELTKKTTRQVFIEPMDSCPSCTSEYMNEEEDVMWCNAYDKPCREVSECDQYEEFIE